MLRVIENATPWTQVAVNHALISAESDEAENVGLGKSKISFDHAVDTLDSSRCPCGIKICDIIEWCIEKFWTHI